MMKKIEDCLHCGQCKGKCPYELDTPTLLEKNYEDYKRILAGELKVVYGPRNASFLKSDVWTKKCCRLQQADRRCISIKEWGIQINTK